ncbi:MAG: hypothetical protein GQ564_13385 [Bacteroidales bacterium]|nr:hypothetical protein [Bacteroidales bacterium]
MKKTITIILFLVLTNISTAQVPQFKNWDYKRLFENNIQSVSVYKIETNEKRNNKRDTIFTHKLILDNENLSVLEVSMNHVYVFIPGIDDGYKLFDTISETSNIQFDNEYKKIIETRKNMYQMGDLTQVIKENRSTRFEYNSNGHLKSKEILLLTDKIRFQASDTIYKKSNLSSTVFFKYDKNGNLISEYEDNFIKRKLKYNKQNHVIREISYNYSGDRIIEIKNKYKYKNTLIVSKVITHKSGSSIEIVEQLFDNESRIVKQSRKHFIDSFNEQILFINHVSTFEYSGDLLISLKRNNDGQLDKEIYYEYNKMGLISNVLIKTAKKVSEQLMYIYQ